VNLDGVAMKPRNIKFLEKDFTILPSTKNLGLESLYTVYSRFTLHALKKEHASKALKWSYENLSNDGILCIEVRSTKSGLYGKGTPVPDEKDAFIYTHYRRFVNSTELIEEVKGLGFHIECFVEEKGLAVFKDDDPVVIRLIARKPNPESNGRQIKH